MAPKGAGAVVVECDREERANQVRAAARTRSVTSAEIAVVVADVWQRNGLGSLLVREVLSAVARHGFARIHVRALTDNHLVHRWTRRFWPDAQPVMRCGEYEYLVPLAA